MGRQSGVVVRLVKDKGFGFIKIDDGKEFFFHRLAAQSWDSLREGTRVTFEEGDGPKGPRAEDVRIAE